MGSPCPTTGVLSASISVRCIQRLDLPFLSAAQQNIARVIQQAGKRQAAVEREEGEVTERGKNCSEKFKIELKRAFYRSSLRRNCGSRATSAGAASQM